MFNRFDYSVIFADMHTESTFLEENIDSYPDLMGWGKIYNPHFVGKPRNKDFDGLLLLIVKPIQ